jgi:hypothetical protein
MALIYGNAYFTIVAALGYDANCGIRGIKGIGMSSEYTMKQTLQLNPGSRKSTIMTE